MEILNVLKLVDSSVAVVSILFVGYMVRGTLTQVLNNQQHIIETLLDLYADDHDDDTRHH